MAVTVWRYFGRAKTIIGIKDITIRRQSETDKGTGVVSHRIRMVIHDITALFVPDYIAHQYYNSYLYTLC